MREGIGLYKAKRIDNGKWVEGNLVLSNDAQDDFKAIIIPQTNNGIFTKHTGFKNISCYLGFEEWYKVDESTLCQWTGLVDKNGVKIFEGDIVRHYNKIDIGMPNEYDVGEIRWYKKGCRFDRTSNNGKGHALIGQHCVYEVIGNINDKAVEE